MAKCDICGTTAHAFQLESLTSIYQLPAVRDVCPACANWANKQLDEIRSKNAPELRRRIAERVSQTTPPRPPRRFFGFTFGP